MGYKLTGYGADVIPPTKTATTETQVLIVLILKDSIEILGIFTLPSSVCFDLLKQPRRSTTNATENFLTTVA